MLYQASRDGFGASNFHSKVDGIQGTLTIIKTVDNFVFGGYTQADWGSNGGIYDQNSFIFSLINNYNIPVKMNIKQYNAAIYAYTYYGPTFGGGHDFYISDSSNLNTQSYSNIYSFEMPNFGTASSLLAGSWNFRTFEIEVYSVTLDRMFLEIFFRIFI
jgi:hypothetical protein